MHIDLNEKQSLSSSFQKEEVEKALAISGIAVWEYYIPTKSIKISPNWYYILGYDPADFEATPSTFYSLVHPEDLEIIDNALTNYLLINENEVLEVEYRIKEKNGNWKWVRNRSALEFDQNNAPLKWTGSVMGISRLKESEHKALQNNVHLNSIVNSLSDIIYEIDASYTFINCWIPKTNPLSTLVKSFKGQKVYQVFSPKIFSHFKTILDNTYKKRKAQQFWYYSDNSKKHYLARTTLLPVGPDGKQNVTMIIQDVTKVQNTQIQLKKKEANLNAIIQNTSDVFWAIDAMENVIVFNQAFSNLYKNLSGDLPIVGQKLDDNFLEPETAKRWRLIHQRSLNGKNTEFSKHIYFNDGKVRLYEFHINPFKNMDGEITGSVVTGRDIDDIYTAKKDAEKSARLKSKFVSTISHEIRTPLNAILGTCHQLERNNQQENLQEDLDILRLASDNLLGLINDVLDFTKLESGAANFKPSQFNIHHFVNGVSQFLQNLAINKGLEFSTEICENLPEFVFTDKTKLHQILTNLLSNAIKYTDEGQVNLQVSTHIISKTTVQITFEISDTGIGIPASELNGVFDSFTQSSTSYDMLKGGTGLGLAISKNLAHLLHGDISVKSEVNEGSTFTFQLEVETPPLSSFVPIQEPEASSLKGIHFLIAEDNEINAKIITRLLGQWDATYDLAVNGEIAVEMAKSKKYDLVLMDIQMPKKNGFDAAFDIKTETEGLNVSTPILALTAQPDYSIDPNFKEGIFKGAILKPFHPDGLKRKLLAALYRNN
tara:strand:- start:24278 stop:26593 length:2316 start_codon:yes stop_codon:yes gene_type:complete